MSAKRSHCTAPQSTKKLKSSTGIFDLNSDCLAEILSYLPINDVFRVYQTDQDFQEAARLRFAMGGVELIDKAFLTAWPKPVLNAFLLSFGKTCQTMKFKLLPEEEFLRVISNFKNLKHLILSEITISRDNIPEGVLPATLKSLELDRCLLSDKLLDEWIPKLNSNLTSIHVAHEEKNNFSELRALSTLHNLSSFLADGMMSRYENLIGEILANNRNTLTSLTMINEYSVIPENIWKNIIQLDNLDHLHLSQMQFQGGIPSHLSLFPKLTSLNVSFYKEYLKSTIESLGCEETLSSLAIGDYGQNFDQVPVSSFKRFKNMRYLELIYGDWSCGYDVMNLAELTQLHSLNLNSGTFQSACEVCNIVVRMPFLRKLSLDNIMIWQGIKDVDAFERKFAKICRRRKQQPFDFEIGVAEC